MNKQSSGRFAVADSRAILGNDADESILLRELNDSKAQVMRHGWQEEFQVHRLDFIDLRHGFESGFGPK
jgi:hypothetical protein